MWAWNQSKDSYKEMGSITWKCEIDWSIFYLVSLSDTCIYIYVYIYIVIHRQICFVLSELISVARQYLPVAGIETRLTPCYAASTDIPDPLSPLVPIFHRFWQVLRATSRILTELLYVSSSWSLCFCSAMCRGPGENITYEPVVSSPAVSCMTGSYNLDSFPDGRSVAI